LVEVTSHQLFTQAELSASRIAGITACARLWVVIMRYKPFIVWMQLFWSVLHTSSPSVFLRQEAKEVFLHFIDGENEVLCICDFPKSSRTAGSPAALVHM
jgi:hypothetical protein